MNYINAHATSTLVGDVAEVKAIKKVFSDMKGVKVNGTKSLIGHCLGAAGGLEAVATIQAIRTGWVHPTLNQASLAQEQGLPLQLLFVHCHGGCDSVVMSLRVSLSCLLQPRRV